MRNKYLKYHFYLSFALLIVLTACNESEPVPSISDTIEPEIIEVKVEVESYVMADSTVIKESDKIIANSEEGVWLAYDVEIPVAGRYKFEVNAKSDADNASVWVEDYIDNTDGRTYNITGSVPIAKGDASQIASIDGSPLNKGIHKMKLHVKGENVEVDGFTFTLMKEHQLTPQTLTQKTDGNEWKVVWSDEFDGTGIPDTDKWTFDIGNWGWGNNELQYYTDGRPENARQENGNLIIEARKNDMGQQWTSARLTTRGKVTFLYGKIEFRAKVPYNKGNWAAGWTLGDSYVDEISWPYCGEIDILESVGFEVNDETGDGIAHCTVHTPAYYFKINNQISSTKNISNISGEFHTYAVEWTPTEVKGFVDGEEYYLYDKTANEKEWPFNQPQNIILNLAMGGGWGGAEGMDETMTSQKFLIDYVRVYEKQ